MLLSASAVDGGAVGRGGLQGEEERIGGGRVVIAGALVYEALSCWCMRP